MDAPLTIAQVAERAGISESFARDLAEAGGFERGPEELDAGSVRRAMLLSACVDAGMPLDAIASALRSGHITLRSLDRTYYERWGERLDTTWEELAAGSGLPLTFVRSMYEALGLPAPEPDDRPRVDEPDLLRAMALPYAGGFDQDALLRLMRVYGESLRRIARTETQMWHEFVDVPAERAGTSQRAILEAGAEFGEAIMSMIDTSTLSMYHRLQEHEWMADLVEHIELALVEAGVYARPERPSTMAFMDISGYTALTEEQGDEAAAELATALAAIVQRTAQHHEGEAMKFLGDGVMFRFKSAPGAVRGAMEVVDAAVPAGLPPAHVGMHMGAVVARDGDVFGRTVNLAARLSGRAGPGEILVTTEIVEAVGESTEIAFEPLGPTELKGVAAPVDVFRVDVP
jgi:adenylate cyclase